MRTLLARLVLLLSCFALLSACQDKHEPTKPTVGVRA
jgi:hypothetical protein